MSNLVVNFKRQENKYLINKNIYDRIIQLGCDFIEKDNYSETVINNVYLDTDDYLLTRRSIEKPKYKEKLRVRGYQSVDNDSKVFLEVKKKCEGVGYKKRLTIKLDELNRRLAVKDYELGNDHIAKEIGWCLSRYQPVPKIYVGYERVAYKGVGVSPLRITFDRNVIYRSNDLKLESGFYGDYIVDKDLVIMEIKTTEGIPLWLTNILNQLKVYPSSFSKVGNAYKKEITKKISERKEV